VLQNYPVTWTCLSLLFVFICALLKLRSGINYSELYINIQSVPRSKHSVSVIKTSQLMLYREIIAVCSEIHTKHTNTVCGQNVGILGAFAKLRKANISFAVSVSPPVRRHETTRPPTGRIFSEI